MSKNSKKTTWNTKYGRRSVRHEAPTLEEAIAAAQGLSDDLGEQAEIAASLMGLPQHQVRAALPKPATTRKSVITSVVFAGSGPGFAPRAVTVERKPARRATSAPNRTGRAAFGGSGGI